MNEIILKNCRILDPLSNSDEAGDICVQNGIITQIGGRIPEHTTKPYIIEMDGQWAMPGFIDSHVSFGEPGREDVETIQEGALRAVKGGFAAVFLLPNTTPPIDNQALVKFILSEGNQSPITILPLGSATMGEKQDRLSEMYELTKAGCIGFSNGRIPILNSLTMRRVLEYTKMVNSTLYAFPDDPNLTNQGFANEGYEATRYGFRATPAESEEIAVSRDILLARLSGGAIHIGPITTKGSCDLVRLAKKKNINLTAFTASHYLKTTDEILYDVLARGKVFPPFRSEEDRLKLIKSCADGTIDVLTSDHNPHPPFEVDQEIEFAPFGISNLETAVASAIEVLIHEGGLEPLIIPKLFALGPAQRMGLSLGVLKEGEVANITCLDANKKIKVTAKTFLGRCSNNPFLGQELRGFPSTLIAKGRIVLEHGELKNLNLRNR